MLQKPSNTVSDRARFSRSRPGQNQRPTITVFHHLQLLIIELLIVVDLEVGRGCWG